ncbi:response regulator transcription factor [Streptomyces poriticola]|uniref:response regulator transcription factor n=1 Tax=Streptomyces poriticola TaxID=3120506 RepID=UPI002FCE1301
MPSIRILLVDAERLVAEGLRNLLETFREFSVVAVAHDQATALRQLHRHHPHLVVMGLGPAAGGAVDAARAIRQDSRHVRIIMLASSQQPIHMREAFVAGANAYLSRDIDAEELRDALLTVHHEGAALSATAAGQVLELVSGGLTGDSSPLALLTRRERQILFLVADDQETRHIAARLGITPKTVRNYLSRIYAKLGTRNRLQTALYALRSLDEDPEPAAKV